jgi:hypothetical protein
MLFKVFLIGFILKNINNRNVILNGAVSTNAVHQRQRSYSEDFENLNSTTNIDLNITHSFFNRKHGYDERYNASKFKPDDEILLNITKFNRQMDLLNKLESKRVSINDKVKLIDDYNRNENENPILPNIKQGGLYKDWETVWDYDYTIKKL